MATQAQTRPTTENENGQSVDPREAIEDLVYELPSPERVEELETRLEEHQEREEMLADRLDVGPNERIYDEVKQILSRLNNHRSFLNEIGDEVLNVEVNGNRPSESWINVIEEIRSVQADRDEAIEAAMEAEENTASQEELEEAREKIKELKRKNANLRDENESLEAENNELQQRLSAAQSAICGE